MEGLQNKKKLKTKRGNESTIFLDLSSSSPSALLPLPLSHFLPSLERSDESCQSHCLHINLGLCLFQATVLSLVMFISTLYFILFFHDIHQFVIAL